MSTSAEREKELGKEKELMQTREVINDVIQIASLIC